MSLATGATSGLNRHRARLVYAAQWIADVVGRTAPEEQRLVIILEDVADAEILGAQRAGNSANEMDGSPISNPSESRLARIAGRFIIST